MAIQTNTPSAFSNQYNGVNLLTSSELIRSFAKAKVDVDPNLYGRYNDSDLGVMALLERLGQKKEVKSTNYEHYEEDFNREIVRVKTGYSTGAATTTFTVADTTPNYVEAYPPSGQTFYPAVSTKYGTSVREGDLLEAKVGATRYFFRVGTVTNAATTTFAAELYDVTGGGATFGAGLENVEIFKTGRAGTETGSTPRGMETKLIKYSNNIQVMDEGFEYSTGSMRVESHFDGENQYNYMRGILNTRNRFDATCDINFLVGRKITSTSTGFDEVLTTEGLIPFIQNYGNEVTYTTLTLDKFQEMSLALRKYSGVDKYMLLCSASFQGELEDLLRESGGLQNGGVIYDAGGGGTHSVDFGFSNFTKGSVQYNVRSLKALDDPKSLGSANSEYQDYALFLPTGSVEAYDEGKQRQNVPAMQIRYQNIEGSDEGMFEWITGGAGAPNPTDDTRKVKVNMAKFAGFEAFLPNTYGIMTK